MGLKFTSRIAFLFSPTRAVHLFRVPLWIWRHLSLLWENTFGTSNNSWWYNFRNFLRFPPNPKLRNKPISSSKNSLPLQYRSEYDSFLPRSMWTNWIISHKSTQYFVVLWYRANFFECTLRKATIALESRSVIRLCRNVGFKVQTLRFFAPAKIG